MRFAMIVLAACSGRPAAPPPSPGAGSAADALVLPKTGAIVLPAEYTRCTADTDCTFTALGCCETTPVRNGRAAEVRTALEASGRSYCAPKTACGPGTDGTWIGTPGSCVAGTCSMPSAPLAIAAVGAIILPATHTACTGDPDCTLVSHGCAHETPVNRRHADATRAAIAASGRTFGPIRSACGPGRGGTWDGAPASCVDQRCDFPIAMIPIAATGEVALPFGFRQCQGDHECTVVSLGCDHVHAVNRTHASVLHRSLQASGRASRPPRDACGPGPDGTMHGVAGWCQKGICRIPKWPK